MPALRGHRHGRGPVGARLLSAPFARGANGALCCERVPLAEIAEGAGTPAYVYSSALIRDRFRRLDEALRDVPHRIHYSLKANSNLAILRLLHELGCKADVVSGGELYRAQRAGFAPGDIIFGGVGKTADELRQALEAGVRLINVESEGELRLLNDIAGSMRRIAPVAIRVNPEVSVKAAHAYIKTGERGNKFGVPYDEVLHVARLAVDLPHLLLLGLDMHVGSQLSKLDPYREGAERLITVYEQLVSEGVESIHYLDVGGGLAVTYDDETPPDIERFAEILVPVARRTGLELILEPGRFLVADAGAMLTRVLYRKQSGGKEYVITDAGMTELLRPSHYQAFHRIEPLEPREGRMVADVVGPVCESGDFLALDRAIECVDPGDVLVVHGSGAYGYVMASNYNSRPRAAEVLVDGDRWAVVTARERYEDLVRAEVTQPEWRHA